MSMKQHQRITKAYTISHSNIERGVKTHLQDTFTRRCQRMIYKGHGGVAPYMVAILWRRPAGSGCVVHPIFLH
jgi:hypothetical protein